jgi:hypothetical protein
MSPQHPSDPPIEILPPPVGSIEERERRLIEAVVALTRSLRDERDRLAARLREVELELSRLSERLEARDDAAGALSAPETAPRVGRPRHPSRTSA